MDPLDEKIFLGEILSGAVDFSRVADRFGTLDFRDPKHRRIFQRMRDIWQRGEAVDRVTVANELMRHNQLQSCDGLSYLVNLSEYGEMQR